MRTPDYFDVPLAINPTVIDEVTVNLESDGITQSEYMRLVEPNGNEIIIPARLIPTIVYSGRESLRNMASIKEEAKVLSNHPSHFADLDFVSGSNRKLVLEGTSADIELTPLISWLAEKDKEPGWRLSIVGATTVRLMFARWDDIENIQKMTETIKNPESLFVMVSLVDPTLATKLASRSAAVNLKKSRAIPKMEIKELRKIVEDADLQSRGELTWSSGGFGNLPIKINGSQVRVAIKVHIPENPVFTTPFVKDATQGYKEQAAAQKIHTQETSDEWMRRFRLLIQETDWRIINLQDGSNPYNYRNSASDFWVTKISEKIGLT